MNNSRHLYHRGVILLLIGVFFHLSTAPTFASMLTLTPPLSHKGLTFSEPLSFSDPTLPQRTLSFTHEETITIKPHSEKNVLAESIITPSPTNTQIQQNPDPTPTSTPTIAKKNTQSLLPTPTRMPPATPTPTTVVPPNSVSLNVPGLNADTLFAMANAYRAERELPAFQKDERSCQLADSRAPEVAGEVASGNLHSGLKARNLDYWNTENIISMRTEEEAFTWWINDDIHRRAIEGNFTYSCVACSGNSCAQEFTNYQPK